MSQLSSDCVSDADLTKVMAESLPDNTSQLIYSKDVTFQQAIMDSREALLENVIYVVQFEGMMYWGFTKPGFHERYCNKDRISSGLRKITKRISHQKTSLRITFFQGTPTFKDKQDEVAARKAWEWWCDPSSKKTDKQHIKIVNIRGVPNAKRRRRGGRVIHPNKRRRRLA
jgi:hypothetical protein